MQVEASTSLGIIPRCLLHWGLVVCAAHVSCGVKLDNVAVKVVVSLTLGLDLCVTHYFHCGALVNAHGHHIFVCQRVVGRSARHHALNDLITRRFASAGTPVTIESFMQSVPNRLHGLMVSSHPVAEQQVITMKCYCYVSSGWVTRHCSRDWCCCRTCCLSQREKYAVKSQTLMH